MDKQTALKGQNAPERPKPIVEGAEPISADMPSIGRSIWSVPKTARPHLVPHGDRAASPDIPLAVERRSVSKTVVGESADTEDQTLAKPQSQELTEEGSVSDSSTEAINSTMRVVGEHSFHSAILSILVDNKPVYVGTLRAARRFPLGRLRGTVSAILRLAPGPHTVAIRIVSEHDHCDETKKIDGKFDANGLKTLAISFVDHKSGMDLAWK